MKKIFLFLAVLIGLLFTNVAFSQVLKLKSSSVAFQSKINDYRWSGWSKWENTSVLIVMDLDKERVTIYSKEKQIYDIVKYEGVTTDDDGDDTVSMFCVNQNGLTCKIRLLKLNSQNGRNQFYVDFSDLRWVYNVYSI